MIDMGMFDIEWGAVLAGLGIGAVTSLLFFAGLGIGMRLALRQERPVLILMLSSAVRIAALLGIGWAVATSLGAFALAGFALMFLVARTIAVALARAGVPAGETT